MKNKITGLVLIGVILLSGIMYYQTHHKSHDKKFPCCDPKKPHH
jgi:hypothetical protein